MKIRGRLRCSCCGIQFKPWPEYEDQDQDKGYGICIRCQELAHEVNEKEYDRCIQLLCSGLNETNRTKLLNMPRDEQKFIVHQAMEDGVLKYFMPRDLNGKVID